MSRRDREQYAKRRDPDCRREWNRQRTARRRQAQIEAGRYNPTPSAPDYAAMANAQVERETGLPRHRFGPAEHQRATMLLVRWAIERDPQSPLRFYDPQRMPGDARKVG